MLLEDAAPAPDDKPVAFVRLDCISRIDDAHSLWWVALEFADATTSPRGMFADEREARALADKLAAAESTTVRLSSFV
jgi:hypothetical protein